MPGQERLEDRPLLRGERQFTADLPHDDALHVVFIRSDLAHGQIDSIDIGTARAADGVVAVETGQSLGLGRFRLFADLPEEMTGTPLATDITRWVGEPLAVVVADTIENATDAADLVDLALTPLTPVVDLNTSAAAAPLYPGTASNVVYELADDGADPIGAEAEHVFEATIANTRLSSAPLECDGIIATPNRELGDDGLDVWCTSQGAHNIRGQLASCLEVDEHSIRVRSPAVGGGFGGRASISPEFVVVCRLALLLRRPVRWVQSRYENLTGMAQGRGYSTTIRMGTDANGIITGIDADIVADAGSSAHLSALLMVSARRQVPGMYRVPNYRCRGTAVLTNTTVIGAYRGAGQPEANHARERLLDIAAARLGLDPVELRRRNLATADEFPMDSAPGPGHETVVYDDADPHRVMDRALELAETDAWRAEQARRRNDGHELQIGIGLANYAQTSARGTPVDSVRVQVRSDGTALIGCASPSHGQGHLTTWSALVSETLGIDPTKVEMIDSDSEAVPTGQATGGSRSTQVAASILVNSCADIITEARPLAAEWLEAAAEDLVVVPAGYGLEAGLAVAGVPTSRVGWSELAQSNENHCLEAARTESVAGAAHPYGSHVSVVEVDTTTGAVALLRHVSVDDCGRVLQPTLLEGQQHGGAVAGLSQALLEHSDHDADGNPLAATFGSYLLPGATEMCSIITDTISTPTDRNVLGTRGIGENGCNGATAAVHNAVMDALRPYEIEHIDMPLSPNRIWEALSSAR